MLLIKDTHRELDDLFESAVSLCLDYRTCSPSILQRAFEIGYARAARIIDQLEDANIISPPSGTKPRTVIIQPDIRLGGKGGTKKHDQLDDLLSNSQLINTILSNFGVVARVCWIDVLEKEICYLLDVGIKTRIDEILKLNKELSLGLASSTGKVKIITPVPGTALVGIFVPTNNSNLVEKYRVLNLNVNRIHQSNTYSIKSNLRRSLFWISNQFYRLASSV